MLGPEIRIAHGRMLLVLDGCQRCFLIPCWFRHKLTYLSPFRFLYRFPQTSHLKGFSFSMPSVPG